MGQSPQCFSGRSWIVDSFRFNVCLAGIERAKMEDEGPACKGAKQNESG